MQKEGVIVKGIAGFYYVELNNGSVYECKARGKFRKEKIAPIVGDKVIISTEDDYDLECNSGDDKLKGVIDEILPRRSLLSRPLVSNVDQAFIVFALKNPDINPGLLDKLLILAEHNNLDVIICLNKSDLDSENSFDYLNSIYSDIGYKIIRTNGKTGDGIDIIKDFAKDKISVFVGPSGVGKSTIFNKIQNRIVMETGEISLKVNRGKHTTRHAELIEIEDNSFIVDTPGFSSMDLDFLRPEELQYTFREFKKYLHDCRFSSCLHNKEKDCKIKEEVEKGTIRAERYKTYVSLLEELQAEYAYRRNKK